MALVKCSDWPYDSARWLLLAVATVAPSAAHARQRSEPALPFGSDFGASLRTHCLDCHDGARGKGGFNLNTVLDGAEPSALRAIRASLVRQDMPPTEETERPSAAEYAAMIAAIDAAVPPARREVPLVRRLNRWQVANGIRDTIGCRHAAAGAESPSALTVTIAAGASANAIGQWSVFA